MTISFNIKESIVNGHLEIITDSHGNKVLIDPKIRKLITWKLTGAVGQWLASREHDGLVQLTIPAITGGGRGTEYTIAFEDPDLAMLFKLTWL